jgi:hypothetical protein
LLAGTTLALSLPGAKATRAAALLKTTLLSAPELLLWSALETLSATALEVLALLKLRPLGLLLLSSALRLSPSLLRWAYHRLLW